MPPYLVVARLPRIPFLSLLLYSIYFLFSKKDLRLFLSFHHCFCGLHCVIFTHYANCAGRLCAIYLLCQLRRSTVCYLLIMPTAPVDCVLFTYYANCAGRLCAICLLCQLRRSTVCYLRIMPTAPVDCVLFTYYDNCAGRLCAIY